MNASLLLVALIVFVLFACNISRSKYKQRFSWWPALALLILAALTFLVWPSIGPGVTALFRLFGAQ